MDASGSIKSATFSPNDPEVVPSSDPETLTPLPPSLDNVRCRRRDDARCLVVAPDSEPIRSMTAWPGRAGAECGRRARRSWPRPRCLAEGAPVHCNRFCSRQTTAADVGGRRLRGGGGSDPKRDKSFMVLTVDEGTAQMLLQAHCGSFRWQNRHIARVESEESSPSCEPKGRGRVRKFDLRLSMRGPPRFGKKRSDQISQSASSRWGTTQKAPSDPHYLDRNAGPS